MTDAAALQSEPAILKEGPHGRIEIASAGIDEFLQGMAGDPYGGLSAPGLRVPFLPTPIGRLDARYLFMLAQFQVGRGSRVRLRGFRQLLTIGFVQNPLTQPRAFELEVTSPTFKFPDGNVSWHLRRMNLSEPFSAIAPGSTRNLTVPAVPIAPPMRNFAFKTSDTPALLYETASMPIAGDPFYVNLDSYTAPAAGQPWGRALASPSFGTFYDLRVPWRADQTWESLDIPIQGPAKIAFYASVAQTDPRRRTPITRSETDPTGLSLSPEERLILNYPNTIYWRVGGALIFEAEN